MDTTVLSLLLGFIIYLFKRMLDKLWINKNFSEKLTFYLDIKFYENV